jgi:hypothetical protein
MCHIYWVVGQIIEDSVQYSAARWRNPTDELKASVCTRIYEGERKRAME